MSVSKPCKGLWMGPLTGAVALIMALGASATSPLPMSTADHAKFEALRKDFATGPDVTRACLDCHTEAAKQIHRTKHWNWSFMNSRTGQMLGKRNTLNNYCLAAISNTAECSSCHVGHGWGEDGSFDLASEANVDCLVCHDTTGAYDRKTLRQGADQLRLPLKEIAQAVGPTSRTTCGVCHFQGGGGEAVKHGDLDSSLIHPSAFLDVHMDADGLNFACAVCHATDRHDVSGSRYAMQAADPRGIDIPGRDDRARSSCQSCHGNTPHAYAKLNDHTDRVACQTCHIPAFSRGDYATKTWWDWSTAGKLDGEKKPFVTLDDDGNELYNSKKGDFRWGLNVVPDYVWFNGTIEYTLLGDRIDPGQVVAINRFAGGPDDPGSRIWPVKMMRGKQPYDAGNRTLVVPHTTGPDGYWTKFDWDKAVRDGMAAAGVPFSGRMGFVETTMLWPITHMVAPAAEALSCQDCHAANGRLANLAGFYMPGRDSNHWVDLGGLALVLLTLGGVSLHALARLLVRLRRG